VRKQETHEFYVSSKIKLSHIINQKLKIGSNEFTLWCKSKAYNNGVASFIILIASIPKQEIACPSNFGHNENRLPKSNQGNTHSGLEKPTLKLCLSKSFAGLHNVGVVYTKDH